MEFLVTKVTVLVFLLVSGPVLSTIEQLSRSIHFRDWINGQKFTKSNFKTRQQVSKRICSLLCAKYPQCRSVNFCWKQLCELNSDDVFSIPNSEERLQGAASCQYFGMLQNDAPFCKMGETIIDIRNDSSSSICGINQKRIDAITNYVIRWVL